MQTDKSVPLNGQQYANKWAIALYRTKVCPWTGKEYPQTSKRMLVKRKSMPLNRKGQKSKPINRKYMPMTEQMYFHEMTKIWPRTEKVYPQTAKFMLTNRKSMPTTRPFEYAYKWTKLWPQTGKIGYTYIDKVCARMDKCMPSNRKSRPTIWKITNKKNWVGLLDVYQLLLRCGRVERVGCGWDYNDCGPCFQAAWSSKLIRVL